MLGSIKYNLSHLLDFTGRDARQTFWYYVLFVFIVNIGIGMILGVVIAGSMIGTAVNAAQSGASDQAVQAQMATGMSAFMNNFMIYGLVSGALNCLLLAAAFVRRLHDSNSSGWWALLALAAQGAAAMISIRLFGTMQPLMRDMMNQTGPMDPARMQALIQAQSHIGFYGLVGWIAPIVVMVFGVMASTDGPNRYGAEPVRF
jgi:uncharacterized membrane protein YhaH (DUF805 family)